MSGGVPPVWKSRSGSPDIGLLIELSVEHDGAVAVEQDAVLAVPGDRPGEGESFGVPAHGDQVLGGAAVVDAGEFLLDDRTFVESAVT